MEEVRTRLDDLAHLLLGKKVVQGEELRGMLSKYNPGIGASLPELPSLPRK